MQRTQLYLPEDLNLRLKLAAKKEKKPTAQLIRELLAEGLQSRHKQTLGDALEGITKLALKGGPPDLSTNLDHYLYDE